MNYSRLGLAALGGTVASFAFGFLVLWLVPALIKEGHKYPAVFRPKEEMFTVMPIGIVATFIAILVVAIIFAMTHQVGHMGRLRSFWTPIASSRDWASTGATWPGVRDGAGGSIRSLEERPWSCKDFYVEDLDGYLICFS
jgi:hypothetical protein